MSKPFYKQKLVTIEIVDGRKFEIDFNNIPAPPEMNFPLGYDYPPNHAAYRIPIVAISTVGYTDIDKCTPECYVHIPPSQIKSVSLRWVPADTPILNIVD